MSRILKYIFPAANVSTVCATQTQAGAGALIINGSLAFQTIGKLRFTDHGYSRSVSITSSDDLTAVTFTVAGTQNGVEITEAITGPNNTTEYGTTIFDEITSITTDGAATNVSVGSGTAGYFNLINVNLQRDVLNYSLSIGALNPNNTPPSMPITVFSVFDNIQNNGRTFDDQLITETNTNIFSVVYLTEDDIQYALNQNTLTAGTNFAASPTRYFLVVLAGEAAHVDNPIQLNFIQT